MKKLKLNDVFPEWYNGGGLFTAFQATGAAPWGESGVSAQLLDMEYHGNRSGEKMVSPALNAISGGEAMDADVRRVLASNLLARYGDYWERLWGTLSLEYNPIENYSMTEEMSNDRTVDQYGKTHTRTDNLSHIKTGTDTTTPNTSETETPNTSETETPDTSETETPNTTSTTHNTTHGFNTSTGVPSDDSTTTETGSTTRTKTGTTTRTVTGTTTRTKTGTEQTTYNTTEADTGTQQDTDGGTDTRTRNYTLTRSGNIGVTTSQQMLQSERELWQSWDFFRIAVFPTLDSFLTLPLY